jgi:hypothetical protein
LFSLVVLSAVRTRVACIQCSFDKKLFSMLSEPESHVKNK